MAELGKVTMDSFPIPCYDTSGTYTVDTVSIVSGKLDGDHYVCNFDIMPKWDRSGSFLGFYCDNTFLDVSRLDSVEPQCTLSRTPPDDASLYFIYSLTSDPQPVVYASRFTAFLQSQISLVLNAIGSAGGTSSGSDLTTLESAAASIESTLSIINDKLDSTATKIENTTVNITNNNSAYNVFYVTDEDGNEHSITSVAGDSLSAGGKLLNFLYKLVVDGALSGVDGAVDGLGDFFFDSNPSGLGEGVSVWD